MIDSPRQLAALVLAIAVLLGSVLGLAELAARRQEDRLDSRIAELRELERRNAELLTQCDEVIKLDDVYCLIEGVP